MSSFVGFVSSIRRLHAPLNSSATPKFRQIALAWPMCRYPFGSGGKRVWTRPPCFPAARSATMISRMKSLGAVPAGASGFEVSMRKPQLYSMYTVPT